MDSVDSWVAGTCDRNRRLAPIYAKAVEEENLQDILLVRAQLAESIMEADRIIADCIIRNIRRRVTDD